MTVLRLKTESTSRLVYFACQTYVFALHVKTESHGYGRKRLP